MIKVTGDVSLPLGISLDEVRLDFLDWAVPLRIIPLRFRKQKYYTCQ
jgi:hypothetical protein